MVDISLDFGMRDGRPVILRELPLEQYGLRCKLSCPECGKPLESVRRSVEHPENGWKCLRHHAGEDSKCEGDGENSCHTLSEYLLSHAIGEKMLLPAIGARDGVPPPMYPGLRRTAPVASGGRTGHGIVQSLTGF